MSEKVTITGDFSVEELYAHRIELFIAFCRWLSSESGAYIWRSKFHHDGLCFDGWFVLGIHMVAGKQITYHLPDNRWQDTDFAETLERAPEFDGHTPADVLERLKRL